MIILFHYLWKRLQNITHQEAKKAIGLSYSVTVLSKKSFPSLNLVPNFKSFWIIIWHQEQKHAASI